MTNGVASCFCCRECGRPITSREFWNYCGWYCNEKAQERIIAMRIAASEKKKREAEKKEKVDE